MDKRREELMKLKSYTEEIDNELTMILQTLQWDRKHLLQNPVLVTCKYDSNHKVPPDKTEEHEKECFLQQHGYCKDDHLLPDPLDSESNTLVKLKKEDIQQIITNASRSDHLFKKGVGCPGAEPLSLERLQASYTADERRAIYDAVVSAVPSCHDLTDLALLSGGDEKSSKVILSRQEILLELRNMRRRRTKYRVAAKSRNYSDVLRDVIKTQMEHYNEGKGETDTKETVDTDNNQRDNDRRHYRPTSKDDRSRYDGKFVPQPIKIKIEREDSTEINRDYSIERSRKTYRHELGNRDGHDTDTDRRGRDDRSRERRLDNYDRTDKYGEHSRIRRYDKETRERRNYYEEPKKRRKDNDPDKEYRNEKRAKRSHRHDDDYQAKKDQGLDDELNNHHRATSRESRREEYRHKDYRHKHKKDRRNDRERSKEGRRDDRYEARPCERIHIKQEREHSITRDGTMSNDYETEKTSRSRKSKSSKHDKSYRDGHSLEIKQEKYDRYYGGPSEEIYDTNKNIKVEK